MTKQVLCRHELICELSRRWPLVNQLLGKFGEDSISERIPWFFTLILSVTEQSEYNSCCIVLDKTHGTAVVTAILLALETLQRDAPSLKEDYAKTTLRVGQRVKVLPDDYVYEFKGYWGEEYPAFLKLGVLEDRKSVRTFPIADVLRLEPTEHMRPKGTLRSKFSDFQRSPLDSLLDLATCGNRSLFRNRVLLQMAKTRFLRIVDSIELSRNPESNYSRLHDLLPWGSVDQYGKLKPNDRYQVSGEPIVAVSKVPEDLALSCSQAPTGSKVVIVDDVAGLTRDLQAYDDITRCQKVVVLATPSDSDAISLLRDRDCQIWNMSPEQVLLGEESYPATLGRSLVGATLRSAHVRQQLQLQVTECNDSLLQSVDKKLIEAAQQLRTIGQPSEEAEDLVNLLYRFFLDCSECCFGVCDDSRAFFARVKMKFTDSIKWVDPIVGQPITEAIAQLTDCESRLCVASEKADALVNSLVDHRDDRWIIATRSSRTAQCLKVELDRLGVDVMVQPIDSLNSSYECGRIILLSWPGQRRFGRLTAQALSSNIQVFAYPFEKIWIEAYVRRLRKFENDNRPSTEELSSILGIEPRLVDSLVAKNLSFSDRDIEQDLPIFEIETRSLERQVKIPNLLIDTEDSRDAQVIYFYGNCYALLTEWAKLTRLSPLSGTNNATRTNIEYVSIALVEPGDFILFRASGDKEIVRLIAEDLIGVDEYQKTRSTAESWKRPLANLGTDVSKVQQELLRSGLRRTTTTIRGWLEDPSRIGPGNLSDLEHIARASQDGKLLNQMTTIRSAILNVRKAHIVAGNQLTSLVLTELGDKLDLLDSQPLFLDLEFGEVWIVNVQRIETSRQPYPSNQVNRLQWIDDTVL